MGFLFVFFQSALFFPVFLFYGAGFSIFLYESKVKAYALRLFALILVVASLAWILFKGLLAAFLPFALAGPLLFMLLLGFDLIFDRLYLVLFEKKTSNSLPAQHSLHIDRLVLAWLIISLAFLNTSLYRYFIFFICTNFLIFVLCYYIIRSIEWQKRLETGRGSFNELSQRLVLSTFLIFVFMLIAKILPVSWGTF